jgi:hypothetical protein
VRGFVNRRGRGLRLTDSHRGLGLAKMRSAGWGGVHARIDYELIAIAIAVPPLVLLAVGAALVWAIRGFFRQQ